MPEKPGEDGAGSRAEDAGRETGGTGEAGEAREAKEGKEGNEGKEGKEGKAAKEAANRLLEFRGLTLAGLEGETVGPFDLELGPGEKALVLHDEIDVLRELIRLTLGWARPLAGDVLYKGKSVFAGNRGLGPEVLAREVGVVHRESVLFSRRSLFDNIMLGYMYNFDEPERVLKARAGAGAESLGIGKDDAKVPTGRLPERKRRLALYALAMSKDPGLYVLERPLQFLDKDFERVWGEMTGRPERPAVLVLGRSREGYDRSRFDRVVVPAVPGDRGGPKG
ncbi:MAG: hypothetical protein LBF41_02970 [Deltaproteobacteria bacterium]|jgi:ABC-type thiamine transport system ATPase subunit|nr:hypothetical protein [Deltaproteobacteria bacterium]